MPMLRIAMVLLTGLVSTAAFSQTVLIENVRIFNGVDHDLMPGHVLVVDGIIDTVSKDRIDAPADARIIDGGNRVLSPGFIDLHTHLAGQNPRSMDKYHPTVAGATAAAMAKHYLDSRRSATPAARIRISRARSRRAWSTGRDCFPPVP
jgi:imidazolonepropionase-like amidohydrolase